MGRSPRSLIVALSLATIALAGNVDHVFNAAGAARSPAWLAYSPLLVVATLAVLIAS